MDNTELHAEKMLEMEFGYACETAAQAVNDRTTVVNLYLLLVGGVGSVLAALAALNPSQQTISPIGIEIPRNVFALAFFLLGLIGFFTIFKLIRIRQAWYDSALEMNRIKEYYLAHFPDLQNAFGWRLATIPAQGKVWSITFILMLLVAVIDSSALGVSVHLAQGTAPNVWLDAAAVFAMLVLQIGFYFYQLSPGEIAVREASKQK